jgi:uncharacterized protein (TIGR00297 family)
LTEPLLLFAIAFLLLGAALLAKLELLCGWKWVLLILLFLVMAMLATRVKASYKREKSIVAWETTRTWQNVLANGGLPTFLAVAEAFIPLEVFILGFIGALSAATADTLATEIGMLYPRDPRLLVYPKKQVPPGTSGAVSPLGEVAMIASSLAVGFGAWIIGFGSWSLGQLLLISLVAGVIGCTFDSLLGCTIQAVYGCSLCGKLTEKSNHCGRRAVHLGGHRLINNDVVNFSAILVGAITAIVLLT